MELICYKDPTAQQIQPINTTLINYHQRYRQLTPAIDLAILAQVDGEYAGGIMGRFSGRWLEIHFLAVEEGFREQGIGKFLLFTLEDKAREAGCRFSFLDALGFQAKGFYEKYGYSELFYLQKTPFQETKHFMKKVL